RERCRRSFVPSFLAALAEAADGAVMGDGEYPCRSRRPSLIPAGTAPDLQKHFVGELFCNCGVLHETQDESEYTQLMACKYGAQSSHVSGGNSFYQRRLVSGPSHAESPVRRHAQGLSLRCGPRFIAIVRSYARLAR